MIMTILKFVAISICITACIALGLIASQRPQKINADALEGGLNFAQTMQSGVVQMPAPNMVPMRDGWAMPVRAYGENNAKDKPLLIMIHGSGWNGLQFSRLGKALEDDAHVVVLDLRGHGAQPERRGDVDYIGQMEDDLADVIDYIKIDGQSVVLLGHSSGGGLVTRFAGGVHGALMDRAILLAPFLKHDAPTTRPNSGGWAHVLLRRIIGLSMLNSIGITALNHLPIIQFTMPDAVLKGKFGHLATTTYSYRLNTGFAPRSDYLKDIAALPEFALIVGADDEAFYADQYQKVMEPVTDKGSYQVVPGKDHLGIVHASETADAIRAFLQ